MCVMHINSQSPREKKVMGREREGEREKERRVGSLNMSPISSYILVHDPQLLELFGMIGSMALLDEVCHCY